MKEDGAEVAAKLNASASPAASFEKPGTGSASPAGTPAANPYPFDSEQVRFALDENIWKKISDDEGIQAYERREGKNPYGDVVAFRGETVLPAKLAKIATILATPELQGEWVDAMEDYRLIEKVSKFETIEYNKTGVPWPFQDRDFVFRASVKVQIDPPLMLILMKSIEDPRAPPVKGVVRGEMLISYFYMKEIAPNQTRVVVEMAVDPKGAIPLWLVNLTQKKWPHNTLSRLRILAARESIPVSKEIEEFFQKQKRGKKK